MCSAPAPSSRGRDEIFAVFDSDHSTISSADAAAYGDDDIAKNIVPLPRVSRCDGIALTGCIVYATCSLLAQENQSVVDDFLNEHPDFEVIPAATILRTQSIDVAHAARFAPYFVMLPHLHGTDGFFAAVFERR